MKLSSLPAVTALRYLFLIILHINFKGTSTGKLFIHISSTAYMFRKFTFSINVTMKYKHSQQSVQTLMKCIFLSFWQIMNDVGSGTFSDFSSIQSVNISGSVTSSDPSAGAITYRSQLLYKFSCYYPLQYLLNNTQVSVWVLFAAPKHPNLHH